MSVKVVALLNPFSTERTESEVSTAPIEVIIKNLDAEIPGTQWRVLLNDEVIEDFSRIPKDGDTLYVRLIPGNDQHEVGEGMKWGGAALTILGIAACFIPYAGAFLGPALIGAGVGLLSGGIYIYNFQVPELNEREAPEHDPSIRGSRNQSRLYGYVPILLGRRRIYCDNAMQSYTWVDPSSGSMYLYQMFCLGQKDMEIESDSFKIDETPLESFSASGSIQKILAGEDSIVTLKVAHGESEAPLSHKCVHEIQIQKILKHEADSGVSGAVIQTTPDKTDEINVDIFFYNGLGEYDDKGNLKSRTVIVRAWYKEASQPDAAYQRLGYFKGSSDSISGAELKTKRYAITKSGLTPGKYTIKIERVSGDNSSGQIIDSVYVGSIRAIKNEQPVLPEICQKITLIGLKVKATDKLQNFIEQFNVCARSKLPVLQGDGFSSVDWNRTALSSNPASCAVYAMQGELAQQRLSDREIDWQAFSKLSRWCDKNEYECNAYVYDSITIKELLDSIASTCRAEVFRQNGKLTVVQDIERASFTQMFTPRNSWGFKETMELPSIPEALELDYDDEEAGYAHNQCIVYNTPDGNKQKEAGVTQKVNFWGVTNSRQTRRLGMYKYAVSKHRGSLYQFSADFEYLMCNKGDWIKYAGDIALAGISQGRITERLVDTEGLVYGFRVDESCPTETGKEYGIRIRKKTGESVLYNLANCFETELRLEEPVPKKDAPEEGDLFMFGQRGQESIDLIITDIQCGENLSADIVCVEYAPEIFGVDDDGFVLPDYKNNLSETAGTVDHGTISVDSWQTWYTYNDSREQPEIPTGNGVSDGWHRGQTDASRWMSSKTAATIYEGEWSVPSPTANASSHDIASLLEGTFASEDRPEDVKDLNAIATRDGVEITWNSPGQGLKNTITRYCAKEFSAGDEGFSAETSQTSVLVRYEDFVVPDNDKGYSRVNRFPEQEEIKNLSIIVFATNIYNKVSVGAIKKIDTSSYGTWKLPVPVVAAEIEARLVVLKISLPKRSDNREIYGTVRYQVQVKRLGCADDDVNPYRDDIPADLNWYKPATSSDPEGASENYRDGTSMDWLEISGSTYTQYLPLLGQDLNPQKLVNTKYQFRVRAVSDADTSSPNENIYVIATCKLLSDIVHAHEYYKDLYVEKLSAISVNAGEITSGSLKSPIKEGEGSSRVILDLTNEEFRVGNNPKLENDDADDAFYLHYKKGSLTARFASFLIKAMASVISGLFAVRDKNGKKENFLVVNPEASDDNDENSGVGSNVPAQTARLFGTMQAERSELAPDDRRMKEVVDYYAWSAATLTSTNRSRNPSFELAKDLIYMAAVVDEIFWSVWEYKSDSSELLPLIELREKLYEGEFLDSGIFYPKKFYVRPADSERLYADETDEILFKRIDEETGNIIYTYYEDVNKLFSDKLFSEGKIYEPYIGRLEKIPPAVPVPFSYNVELIGKDETGVYLYDAHSREDEVLFFWVKTVSHLEHDPLPGEAEAKLIANGTITAQKVYGAVWNE